MKKVTKTNIDLDIRAFRRFAKKLDCIVHINNKTLHAKTFDYSFSGLSILIEDSLSLKPGDVIDLDIDELYIHQKGRVQWTTMIQSRLRAGILRIGSLNGSFRDYQLSDILIGLQRTLKTGILDVRKGLIDKKVYIKNGNIIFASSNQDEDRLGDILLQYRKISKEQYDKAAEYKKQTGKRFVVILIALDFLKPSELIFAAELQAKVIIESLLTLRDADFEFKECSFKSKDVLTLKLPVANLIYREVKNNANTDLLVEYLLDSIIDFSSTPLNLFQKIDLDNTDRSIISLVDGKTRMEDITRLSPASKTDTLKTIYALLEARILLIKGEKEAPHGITVEEVFDKIQETPRELIDKIENMYSQYNNLGYYEVLGLKEGATDDEIKKAYYRTAKEFHPDKNFGLPADMKKKLLEIFTYITNAYITLRDSESRKKYSQGIRSNQSEAVQNTEIAQSKFLEGKHKFKKEKFADAAQLFASAIYFDRTVAKYHYYYGYALEKVGKQKDAVIALNNALKLKPYDADILAELGHVYLKLGFQLRAKGYFNNSLKINPSNKRAKEGIGTFL
jgi:curved DNA-binding protein CbpA